MAFVLGVDIKPLLYIELINNSHRTIACRDIIGD